LKEYGARATFFVVGREAERYPDLVRRMAAEGHEVGNHSYSHGDPDQTSARQLLAEVRRTAEVVDPLAGRASGLFRPPKGKLTARKLLSLWWNRQTLVLWNVDPKDFALGSPTEVRDWFAQRPLKAGDLALLHDTSPHTAAALPELLDRAHRAGLHFVTVGHWLGRNPGDSIHSRQPLISTVN
jgi:peptidoglycan/xylan/chitin deacetylase (PgdA/CDA1 family)